VSTWGMHGVCDLGKVGEQLAREGQQLQVATNWTRGSSLRPAYISTYRGFS